MKKGNTIKPVGLKGKDVTNRMLDLMNINESVETNHRSVVELTKKGPDGKAYAIVRENHEYYIKIANKTKGLVFEDFKYIGGLKNKKSQVFESYAKATKQLNMKFKSLNEAYGISDNINTLLDDNLLEHHPMNPNAKLSATKGVGDADEYIVDKKGEKLDYDADEDTEFHGTNSTKKKVKNDTTKVKVDMSENESAIDRMITGVNENFDGYNSPEEIDNVAEHQDYNWFVINPNGKIVAGDEYLSDAFDSFIQNSGDQSEADELYIDTEEGEMSVRDYIDDFMSVYGFGEPDEDFGDYDQGELDEFIENLSQMLPNARGEYGDGEPMGEYFTQGYRIIKRDEFGMNEAPKRGLSIERAINEMDSIVESVYGSDKVDDILEGLSKSEKEAMYNALKKKH